MVPKSLTHSDEATRLLACTESPKHRAVLSICFAAGLRLSEATHLSVAYIDGQRQTLHIRNGKGRKERLVPASPRLLDSLRAYWRLTRPGHCVFPGRTADSPLSSATIQKACKLIAAKAKIQKAVTPHTHCRIHDRRPSLLESDDSQQRARRDLLGEKPRPPQQVAAVHSQGS